MMPLILAQQLAPETSSSALVIGIVVLGISSIASLGVSVVTLFRMGNGNDSQRQIEPTEFHAIKTELGQQTIMLGNINREVGETKTSVGAVKHEVAQLRADQRNETDNIFKRINAISTESASTKQRVDDHLSDHRQQR